MMYPSPRQFLLTPPQSLDQAQTWGLPLAHMAYQLDETVNFARPLSRPMARVV